MRSIPHRQSENKGKMAVVKVQMIILSQFLANSSGNLFRASTINCEFDWYSIVHINVAVAMTKLHCSLNHACQVVHLPSRSYLPNANHCTSFFGCDDWDEGLYGPS